MQRPDKEPSEKTSDVKYAFVCGVFNNDEIIKKRGTFPHKSLRHCGFRKLTSLFHKGRIACVHMGAILRRISTKSKKRKQFGGNYGRNVRQEAMFLMMRAEEQIKKNVSSEI